MKNEKGNDMSGKLIVIEGADSSGKATQTKLLLERMRQTWPTQTTTAFAFPRREKPTGAFVCRCIEGAFGNFVEESPYYASLPYILDFVCAREEIADAVRRGYVLCDRFTPSNLAYQSAKCMTRTSERAFIEWLEHTTHIVHRIPEPDVVIYLDVPLAVSMRLMEERGETRDQHEADLDYQDRVIERYHEIAVERPNWHVIKCAPDGQNILPKNEIHEKIWKVVSPLI